MLLQRHALFAGLFSFARARHSHALMTDTAERLQRHLDLVSLAAPPRVELTYGIPPTEATSLAVLDSSFNPPTRAHLHLLASSMERFGTARALLLLAKQNADKAVVGASLVQRLQMMELLAREEVVVREARQDLKLAARSCGCACLRAGEML